MLFTVKKKVLLSSAFLGVEHLFVHEYQALALARISTLKKKSLGKGLITVPI